MEDLKGAIGKFGRIVIKTTFLQDCQTMQDWVNNLPTTYTSLTKFNVQDERLYGKFNLLTNEWFDGIVPKLVRECDL